MKSPAINYRRCPISTLGELKNGHLFFSLPFSGLLENSVHFAVENEGEGNGNSNAHKSLEDMTCPYEAGSQSGETMTFFLIKNL